MFTLDTIDDTVIQLHRIEGCNEIRFPKELIDRLHGEWVWEIYFDNIYFDDTTIYIEGTEFVAHISDAAMGILDWKHGDSITWTVREGPEGNEVRVVKTDGE